MNILSSTRGEFVFMLEDFTKVTFDDWNDIPEDFDYAHVIKFSPKIPPAPHTPEQHMEVNEWNKRLADCMAKVRSKSTFTPGG